MERIEWTRLRWRMRGAWQWPAFAVLTVVEAVLLSVLPVWGDGPGGIVPALLLAGCLNLIVVALAAPLGGLLLRRRRRDLPRAIAADYAGTALLGVLFAGLLAGGVAHRGDLKAAERDRTEQFVAVAHYVESQEPGYEDGLSGADAMRLEPGLYRTCVPGPDPDRWLCLIVDTRQSPPGVTRDSDAAPNAVYRRHGGFD